MNVRTILGLLLLSAAVIASHALPGLDNSEIETGIRNGLHVLVFATFSAIVFESLNGPSMRTAIVATIIIVTIVGGLGELFQYSAGKRPDFFDFMRDLSGMALALGCRFLWRRSHIDDTSNRSRRVMQAGSALLGAMIVTPLLYWFIVIGLSRSTFPTILDFDNWWDKHLFYPVNADITFPIAVSDWPMAARSAAEIRLSAWGRSGLAILPVVSNWTDYQYLTFVAAIIKGPDTTVTVRINDEERAHNLADRFIATITVTNEPDNFRIPLHEMIIEPGYPAMNLSDIQEIVIFARDKRSGTIMLLDEIRLR